MKKIISILLTVLMVASLIVTPATANNEVVGGFPVVAEDGGYLKDNGDGTLTAVAYYGNTFAGWYKNGQKLSGGEYDTLTVSSGEANKGVSAVFNAYNQMVDGDFESADPNAAIFYNTLAYNNSPIFKNNRVVELPVEVTNGNHGKYALWCEPAESGTASNYAASQRLVRIPISIKAGTEYALHLSYYIPENPVKTDGTAVHADGWATTPGAMLSGEFTATRWTKYWKKESAAVPSGWCGHTHANASFNATGTTPRVQWSGYPNDKYGLWVDVYVLFTATNTEETYFDFGIANNCVSGFYLDNISLTEAATAPSTVITAKASGNGAVVLNDAAIMKFDHAEKSGATTADLDKYADYHVAGSTRYSKVAYRTYTAVANDGSKFIGWYDANNNLVSKNATETFMVEGAYTAKFSLGVSAGEGGYLVENENDYVTATPLFGNSFLGWFDGNTLVSSNPKILNDGSVTYVAKFGCYNQIVDGDFNEGSGLDFWQSGWVAAMTLTKSFGMNDDTGMKATTKSDAMLAVRIPVTVKKNGKYVLSYNMKVNSYSATGTNVPVYGMMISGSPDGTNNWGKWPKLGRWNITISSVEDPSKYIFFERVDFEENRQIHLPEIEKACGTGWLTFTLEFEMDDSTENSYVGNIFEKSDTATIYLGMSANKAATDINYDNFSFYEKTAEVKYEGRENVRVDRVDVGPIEKGLPYSFKLVKDDATNITSVKFNGQEITASNGVYNVVLDAENTISVTTDSDDDYTVAGKDFEGNDLTDWSYELYNIPLWEGDTVYQESVVFYPGRTEAKLLYPIDEIVSVRSYDMKKHYVYGVDYDIVDGKLVLLEGGSIPKFSYGPVLDSDNPHYTGSNHVASDETGVKVGYYWAYDSYSYYVHVTYKHTETWADRGEEGYSGLKQESLLSEMPYVAQKLENGEDVHIVFYGDSMTSGMSSSGGLAYTYDEANDGTLEKGGWYVAPFIPNWMTIFVEGLKAEYPDSNITWENLSSIGKTAAWGDENLAARWALLEKEPDLFLIGWGINDNGQGVATASYKASVNNIINKVKSYNSDTSIMLYGGSGVNDFIKKYDWPTLRSFAGALKELGAQYDNVAATNFTEIFMDFAAELDTVDVFADNTVHANDFGGRIYSGVMLAALTSEKSDDEEDDDEKELYTYTVTNGEATITGFDKSFSGAVIIPSTLGGYPVTRIDANAFFGCYEITSVVIPDSVKIIANGAFQECSKLKNVTIGKGVTVIAEYAFAGCNALESIVIPEGVTTIGRYAFRQCRSLAEVDVADTVTTVYDSVFEDTAWYKALPDGMVYVGKVAYKYKGTCPDGTNITLKDGTVNVAPYAFEGCAGLTNIVIPEGVQRIGYNAFTDCVNLESVTLPKSIVAIETYAFTRCFELRTVYYDGIFADRQNISIATGNTTLTDATWKYNQEGWILDGGKWILYREGVMLKGWQKDGGKWYYLDPTTGYMVANKWMKDSKGWVYLGSSGAMLTNAWCTDSQGWCYVGADGYAVTNCWKKDSKGWIWLNANGSMTKNAWVKDGGKWYFLDANGYMVTNKWMKDSKGWCYLGSSGAMATNAWVRDSIGWCYVGADGYAVTNCWKKDSTGWCYLNSQGSMVKNNWVKDGGKWYFLDKNGYMVANKTVTISGKAYKFNASGVCLNP